jgi:hypothetical protein
MSSELVPGDVLEVSGHGAGMFCDAVLLEGQAKKIQLIEDNPKNLCISKIAGNCVDSFYPSLFSWGVLCTFLI